MTTLKLHTIKIIVRKPSADLVDKLPERSWRHTSQTIPGETRSITPMSPFTSKSNLSKCLNQCTHSLKQVKCSLSQPNAKRMFFPQRHASSFYY
ncbi:hypothetical protein E2C01_023104 [Portunus trituberculatus]|uniref:Uncharacterized protein n=1 Tax=Portunus trituberculatus TaxID=210409 RepID=A0A5B7EAA3_PORTR|nr:hypothetical protein [Portunus trituberculatus]